MNPLLAAEQIRKQPEILYSPEHLKKLVLMLDAIIDVMMQHKDLVPHFCEEMEFIERDGSCNWCGEKGTRE